MKSKKVLSTIIILLLNFNVACSKNMEETQNVDLFNSKIAQDLAEEYLYLIKNNNMNLANNLCTNKLLNENKEINLGDSKIVAFANDSVIESANSAYFTFNVVRNVEDSSRSDLDNYTIKVIRENEDYKIDEVKAISQKQAFVKNDSLRLIEENGGDSDLVMSLKNMFKDIYLKENKLMLYKEQVVADKFGPISLGYKGQRIAISTIGDNKTLIAIAYINENDKEKGSASIDIEVSSGDIDGILDKPIAKRVITLDMLENITIKRLVFTKEEEYLIVEYLNDKSNNRINIYNTSNGDIIPINFDLMFPAEKYSITLKDFDENKCIINVESKNNDIRNELLGEYKIDIRGKAIEKNI